MTPSPSTMLHEMPGDTGVEFVERLHPEMSRDDVIEAIQRTRETRASAIYRAVMAGRDDILASECFGCEIVPGIHDRMLKHQWRNKKSLLLAFRGSGKTTVTTGISQVGDALRDRNVRMCIASKTSENAEGIVRPLRETLESSEDIKEIFGEVVGDGQWNNSGFVIAGRTAAFSEPTVNTMGVLGASAGKHYDRIDGDDLVDKPNALTPLTRRRLLEWVYEVMNPMLLPPDEAHPRRGQMHYKGTRYADQDLYGHLIKNEMTGDRTLRIPIKKEDGHSVWPARFSDEWIRETEIASGGIAFGGQFMMSTNAMKGKIFKYDDCPQYGTEDYPSAAEMVFYTGVDLSTGEAEDEFAIATIARDPRRWHEIWVWDYFMGKLGWDDQTGKVVQFGRYRPTKTGVEVNGYQKMKFRDLREKHPELNIVPVDTSDSKTLRGIRLSGKFTSQHVRFLRGAHYGLIQHLVDFDGHKGGKDDGFDALDIAIQISERPGSSGGGRNTRTPENEPGLL